MPSITLLSADTSLTKRITKVNDAFQIDPYPLISKVTSTNRDYDDIQTLFAIISAGANTAHCILKGQPTKDLNNESRRGFNDPLAPTQLLVIDYDREDGFDSPDHLLTAIDPALEDVSYIWQISASSGINNKPGIRGHAFILLSQPVSPNLIKEWLIKVNLTTPEFRQRINLSLNAMALCYPLDTSANQNDKLIYIAPPKCIGFTDPIAPEDRIRLIRKANDTFNLLPSISPQQNRELRDDLLKEKQEAAGLKFRAPKYAIHNNLEIVENPSTCVVTGEQDCGEFVRLNLNGCQRFPYWYYRNDPEVLHNFRGEEPTFLREIVPSYYAEKFGLKSLSTQKYLEPFVFRDPNTDTYFNGIADFTNGTIETLNRTTSKDRLRDFLGQYGKKITKHVDDWTVNYDPTNPLEICPKTKWVNTFKPTEYLNQSGNGAYTPIIERIIRHICVDEETHDYFINWLAFIIQNRTQTGTAWIFHGTEGTGKGVLFHHILSPILGLSNARIIETQNLEDKYNEFVSGNLLIFLDEGNISDDRSANQLMGKLKDYISEPYVPIRAMRCAPIQSRNWSNWIVATNEIGAIKLSKSDRRWNVAPRQNKPIQLSIEDIKHIPHELRNFANYLHQYNVNVDQIRTALNNKAKHELCNLRKTGADVFFESLETGNLEYFADYLHEDDGSIPPRGYYEFEQVLRHWMTSNGKPLKVRMIDLHTVYKFVTQKFEISRQKFAFLCTAQGLESHRSRVDGKPNQHAILTFQPLEDLEIPERPNNIVPFGRPQC